MSTLKNAQKSGVTPLKPPRVGFVSLGCPKALVDSEQILTQLRAEGYAIAPSYDGADLVVVNTCGFIDAAVAESLDAIGEALAENGKVIVTGCLGAKEGGAFVRDAHPKVLAVTGPHATQEVMSAVHLHLPKPHDPFVDLVPKQGIKLTPTHYAYLKISEGCNHRCTFCIIPSMRGDLVSRPIGEVLAEAENLVKAGVKELLVISQDTSAYGVDVKYRNGFWQGRPVKTKMVELARALGEMGVWVRLHYVYPYPHVDDVIPLMAEGKLLPYLDVPFQHASPRILKLMKRPANAENTLARIRAWRAVCPDITIRSTFIAGFPGETDAEFEELLAFLDEAQTRPCRLLRLLARGRCRGQRIARPCAAGNPRGTPGALHADAGAHQRRAAATESRQDLGRAGRRGRWPHSHRALECGRPGNRRYRPHRRRQDAARRRVCPGDRYRIHGARSARANRPLVVRPAGHAGRLSLSWMRAIALGRANCLPATKSVALPCSRSGHVASSRMSASARGHSPNPEAGFR